VVDEHTMIESLGPNRVDGSIQSVLEALSNHAQHQRPGLVEKEYPFATAGRHLRGSSCSRSKRAIEIRDPELGKPTGPIDRGVNA
jgi:hypothetical protein